MLNGILLAVDDTPASAKVADYVGEMLQLHANARRKHDGKRVHIVHCYPRTLEPQYATAAMSTREVGEGSYDYELQRRYDMANSMVQVRKAADSAREQLVEQGVPRESIEVHHIPCDPDVDVAWQIVESARKLDCNTIAVGRNRDGRVLRSHVSDGVIKYSEGRVVWVIH